MSRTTQALKRLGVAGVALVTVGAGLPAILATSASAAPATQISIEPSSQTIATGTCETFTVRTRDASGAASDTATVTVELIDPSPADNTAAGLASNDDASAQFCFEDANGTSFTTTQAGVTARSGTGANSNRRTITFVVTNGARTFGVVNSQEETVTLRAFTDANGDGTFDPNTDFRSADASAVFGPGSGNANGAASQTANDNVRTITEVPSATPTTTIAGGSQTIQVRLTNVNGDEVAGATPRIRVQSGGANSNGTANNPAATTAPREGSCSVSNNAGISTCQIAVPNAGTDTFLIFVNQTNGGTPGPDASEPQLTVTRTTAQAPNTNPAAARNIDLTPEGPVTATSGTDRVFTATVTDVNGRAVQGVTVTFTEDGAGVFVGQTNVTTDQLGQARVTLRTAQGETGQSTVRAEIATTGTQCGQAAGTGTGATSTTTAGNCIDAEVTNFVAGSASPSANPGPTGTASPSPRATGTASPSASPSATAGTTSPSPSNTAGTGTAPGCQVVAQVRLERTTITATGSTGVRVTTTPNSVVELFAYSRPSTTFRVVRQAEVGADGVAEFRIVPPTNTRLFAQQRGCAAGPQVVLNVRTQLSLNVVRNGTRNYTFSGRALPARNGGLIVSLFRVTNDGRQILAAQTRADASTGTYTIRRQFTGSGRFGFVVRTGQDLQNAPGSSNVRSLAVF